MCSTLSFAFEGGTWLIVFIPGHFPFYLLYLAFRIAEYEYPTRIRENRSIQNVKSLLTYMKIALYQGSVMCYKIR